MQDKLTTLTERKAYERATAEERARKKIEEMEQMAARNRKAATHQALNDLSSLMMSSSKSQFEVGKRAAIAETTISTFEGAQKAFTAFAGTGPWGMALGIAAAAAAVAAGMARVSSIKSTSFQGGGSAGMSSGGISVPSLNSGSLSAPPLPAPPSADTLQTPSRAITVNILGDNYGSDIKEKIVEAIRDAMSRDVSLV